MLPQAVLALGLTSLFTDASGEMVVPLLPAFLAAHLAHPAFVLGLMEGLADGVSALLKWVSGRWVDRGWKLKPFVVGGYALASLVRPLMGLVTRPFEAVLVRVADRVGKGVRTSPRDALIARAVDASARGRAFGFNAAMDHVGAGIGALSAMALSGWGVPLGRIFLISAIPAALAVVAVAWTREPPGPGKILHTQHRVPLPSRLWAYLVPVTLFGLGNATDTFVLLRLTELGARPALLPLAWLMIHVVKAAASFPAGMVADRLGPARVVVTGWTLYALSYLALGAVSTVGATLAVTAFYGLYHALSEGTEKALLVELAPGSARGRALGTYHALGGLASLAAGLAFGGVWTRMGSQVAFYGAARWRR